MASMVRRLPLQFHPRTWLRLIALLIALVAALPLLEEGALLNTRGGGDSPFLLQRVQQLASALGDGHFPVRWMPDAAYGYGYPFFNYYAPLSIYAAAFFRFLGAPFTAAIQSSQLVAFLLAAWGAFELARRWLRDDWAALLASAAYTLAPFHLVNVYVRGDSLAEFWAMALYPLVLLAAHRLFQPRQTPAGDPAGFRLALERIAPLTLAYAALILSHNISALIFSPFLLLYILLATLRQRVHKWRALRYAAVALVLGLLLSAWFWLPALVETNLVQTEPVTAGYFHYANHFRGLDLVQGGFFFDWDVAGQAAFRMGLVQALLILAGLVALLWRAASIPRPALIFIVVALLIATFMITPLSRRLWDALPLLPYTQFPWRFLSVQALAGALLTGALALLPGRRLWSVVAALLLLVATLPSLEVDHLVLSDADVTPLRLAQYEWFTGNIGTTVSAEYLPHTARPRPYSSAWLNDGAPNNVRALAGEATATLISRRTARQRWQVQVSSEQASLQFPTFYWPGWQAHVDGRPVAIDGASGSGWIVVDVPEGAHQVELALARTPVRLAAELISLTALLGLSLWAVFGVRRSSAAYWRRGGNWLLVFVVILLLLGAFWRLRAAPDDAPQALNWDFAQIGYLHRAPRGILFDNGSRLVRYDYNTSTLVAGETLRVALEWQNTPTAAPAAGLALVTPAVHRNDHAPLLIAAAEPLQNGRVIYELPIPANAPPGLYVPRLEQDSASSRTPAGHSRGPLFLRPVRVESPAETLAAERSLDVRVDDVLLPAALPTPDSAATGLFDCASGASSPGALQLHLAWITREPLDANLTASLRLNDARGQRIAQCDMQPGYGFLPSVAWQPATWTPDRLALPLPALLPPSSHYVLVVTLYDAAGNQPLTRRLGRLEWQDETLVYRAHEPQFTLPSDVEPLQIRFGDAITLRGYRLQREGAAVQVTFYWQALQPIEDDYRRFVHLLPDESGPPVAQQDGAPQHDMYPTDQWTAGEIVEDVVALAADGLLATGFYPPGDPAARLPVYDEQGQLLPDGRFILRLSTP